MTAAEHSPAGGLPARHSTQIAADALEVPMEDVDLRIGDTAW